MAGVLMPLSSMLIASGRVQGVGFRAHAALHARKFGITGSVQNMPDGTVKIIAEAKDKEELEQFISALKSRTFLGGIASRISMASSRFIGTRTHKDFQILF
jgi:acylphosphatase